MAAILLFIVTYVAVSFGHIPGFRSDRVAAAIVGGALMLAFGVLTMTEAQAAVDGSTLALLFGMMVLSTALEMSGTFALLGWWLTGRARSPLALLALVSVGAASLSAFLINDVVCLAFTPLVLHVAESFECDPKPYLIALATSSNIGSVATITGNPQNVLIGSLAKIGFGQFALTLAPVAALSLLANIAIIAWVFRDSLAEPFPRPDQAPRPRVYARWMWKSALLTGAVLGAFVLGAPPAIAALVAASSMLLTRAVDPRRLYQRIDWPLLALFTGLFVVVGGAEHAGVGRWLLERLEPLHPDTSLGLTAVTAVLSNVVSNVPAVMLLKSVVPHLARPEVAWLTLAMSSTLAGNLTLAGSLATIIVVERARTRTQITFLEFLKVGVPTTLASLTIGVLWLSWMT